jgi:protein ImuA
MEIRSTRIADLRRSIAALERPGGKSEDAAIDFGVTEIDAALPWRGLPHGGIHEMLGRAGDGARFGFATMLAARAARTTGRDGTVLWCRSRAIERESGLSYGPGLSRFGLHPAMAVFAVLCATRDLLQVLEEGLGCGALAAVIGEGAVLDTTAARRLQLAAERGRTPALLLPPAGASPSAVATTRWRIAALPNGPGEERRGVGAGTSVPGPARWRLSLLRCRGGAPQEWDVEWEDATLSLHMAAALADGSLATPARCAG